MPMIADRVPAETVVTIPQAAYLLGTHPMTFYTEVRRLKLPTCDVSRPGSRNGRTIRAIEIKQIEALCGGPITRSELADAMEKADAFHHSEAERLSKATQSRRKAVKRVKARIAMHRAQPKTAPQSRSMLWTFLQAIGLWSA